MALAFLAASVVLGTNRRDNLVPDASDELTHYDYVMNLDEGHIPRWGTLLQPDTTRLSYCLQAAVAPPHCTAPPGFGVGYDYEAQQPPLVYLPYILTSNPSASPAAALRDARWGGAIWAGAAAALIVALGVVEDLSLLRLMVVFAICLLSPVAVSAEATVTNDSASVAAGLLGLVAVGLCRHRSVRSAVALLKPLTVFVPLALVAGALFEDSPGPALRVRVPALMRRHACALSMVAGTALSSVAWEALQEVRATVAPTEVLYHLQRAEVTHHIQWVTIFSGLQQQLTLMEPLYPNAPFYWLWNLAVFGTLITVALVARSSREALRTRGMAAGALAGLAALAVFWPVASYLEGHYNYFAPVRYGLPLVPLVALALARFYRRFGLLAIGLVIPATAAVAQLVAAKF
jgi:hypothetical protein